MSEQQALPDYMAMEYTMLLIAASEGGYVVVFPDLPGCWTQGDSIAEALKMADDARRSWTQACIEIGIIVPMPTKDGEYVAA